MPIRINDEYDIGKAFQAIEEELIASMIRNMQRHKVEEADEGMQWTMWHTEQLRALEKYKKVNGKKYRQQFRDINAQIETLIRMARDEGEMSQEIAILNAIKKGFPVKRISRGAAAEFFRLNDRKLEALIKATQDDMERAETAVLRMANDKYRSVIYNAQVYANTGAGTYEKAVDMAAKDFLSAGLNCIEYTNGARHTLSDYADMAVRTASKRAYLQGEGTKRNEWGIHTVIMNKRGNPCPRCLPFCGKVLIDDVWSGGSSRDGNYPLMSHAISKGLYHPRCKDSHTTFFPGISTADDKWTAKELATIGIQAKEEARQQYARRQSERFGRLARYSLDTENKEQYAVKKKMWETVEKTSRFDIIKSGAVSGARNPYGKAADEHAKRYYELVRSMRTDVSRIAETTGISEKDIQAVKDYLFVQEHNLGMHEKRRFDPDYMIAESWRRLIDGKPEPHDMTLIKHEIMEKELISSGMSQDKAHRLAAEKYNYDKEAQDFYGKIKKFKKE